MINVASTTNNSKPQYRVSSRKSWEMKMPSWLIPPQIPHPFQLSLSPPRPCTQMDRQPFSVLTDALAITQINAQSGKLVALQVPLPRFSNILRSKFRHRALSMSTVDWLITIRRNSRWLKHERFGPTPEDS